MFVSSGRPSPRINDSVLSRRCDQLVFRPSAFPACSTLWRLPRFALEVTVACRNGAALILIVIAVACLASLLHCRITGGLVPLHCIRLPRLAWCVARPVARPVPRISQSRRRARRASNPCPAHGSRNVSAPPGNSIARAIALDPIATDGMQSM